MDLSWSFIVLLLLVLFHNLRYIRKYHCSIYNHEYEQPSKIIIIKVKLFKEGHLPVFKSEKVQKWMRIVSPIPINSVVCKIIFRLKWKEAIKFLLNINLLIILNIILHLHIHGQFQTVMIFLKILFNKINIDILCRMVKLVKVSLVEVLECSQQLKHVKIHKNLCSYK